LVNCDEPPREQLGQMRACQRWRDARAAARSLLSLDDLDRLMQAVDLTGEDERYLRMAGTVLADQAEDMVAEWRAVLAEQPLDQAWLDYQHEIGLRHTRDKKNTTDHADSIAMAHT